MEKKDGLIKDSLILFIATSVVNGANFLFHMYIMRYLDPEGYGVLATLLGIFIIIAMPSVALQMTITKKTSVFKARNSLGGVEHLFKQTTKWFFTLGVISFCFFYFGAAIIEDFFHIKDRVLMLIMGLISIVALVLPVIRGILQGLQKFKGFGSTLIIDGLVRLIAVVIFISLGWGVRGAMGSTLAAGVTAYIAGFLMILFIFRAKEENAETITKKDIISYALPVFFSMLGFSLLGYLDLFMVKHFYPEDQAGFYAVTSIIGKAFLFFPGAIVMALFPKVAESHELKENTSFFLVRSMGLTAAVTFIGIIFCFIFPQFVLSVLAGGDKYFAVTGVVRLFGLAMLPLVLFNVFMNYSLAIHKYTFIYIMFAGILLYGVLLWFFHASFYQVILILFIVNLLILAASLLGFINGKKAAANAKP